MTETNFYKQLLDNLSTALLVIEPDLQVSFISPAAQALLELSESRTLGSGLQDLFPGQAQLLEGVDAVARSHTPFTHRGIVIKLASGLEVSVDCTVTPLAQDGSADARVILELHPVDHMLRINRTEGMITSQETTQALIRGLAHEIKNPLGGLRGAAQLLAKELPDPALEEYTRIIIQESDRLRDLVDRLLGPHKQPHFAALNIHEVLEHIRTLLQAEVGTSVTFLRDYDPSLPDLQGDRGQLVQAVLNIVRNAVRATEDNAGERVIMLRSRIQRQFTIGGRHHRMVCRIDVEDNGDGIPPELMDSLFIPMVSGRADGSGLGLSISQSIVNQHQGLIECRSAPGHTEFSLFIPLEIEHAQTR